MTSIRVPSTIAKGVAKLNDLGTLATATEWERAAIVAAFVRLAPSPGGDQRPSNVSSDNETPTEFAARGIHGLRSHNTVRLYVQRWLDANGGTYPKPGSTVLLPGDEWPPTRGGTDGYASDDGASVTIDRIIAKHGPGVVAQAVAKPAVAAAVLNNPQASMAMIQAQATRAAARPTPKPSPGGGLSGLVQKTVIQITAMAVEDDAIKLRDMLIKHAKDATPWRPKEDEDVLQRLVHATELIGDCVALLTPVTDAGLAEILGQ